MNEYIRREDALASVDKRIETLKKDPVFIRKHGYIDLYGIKTILMAVPAADVAPVVHGRLIKPNPFGNCSVCGFLIDIRDDFSYCPNCGAKMDL